MNETKARETISNVHNPDNRAAMMTKCMREFAAFLQARQVVVTSTITKAKPVAVPNAAVLTPVAAMGQTE